MIKENILEGKVCKVCGSTKKVLKSKAQHIGLYCSMCDSWERWLNKKEKEEYGLKEPEERGKQERGVRSCCKEGEEELRERGQHIGLYCKECGAWKRWVSKKEKVL